MKRGFTLIELLVVIVILAIIEDSKVNSIKRSIELYGGAVEQSVTKF